MLITTCYLLSILCWLSQQRSGTNPQGKMKTKMKMAQSPTFHLLPDPRQTHWLSRLSRGLSYHFNLFITLISEIKGTLDLFVKHFF